VSYLCAFYPGTCLTTEEKALENLSQAKKNLSQSTVYILPKQPHITKPTHTHTHTGPRITKPTHTHTHTGPRITKPTHTHTHTPTLGPVTSTGRFFAVSL
jgi:hypothetical protein